MRKGWRTGHVRGHLVLKSINDRLGIEGNWSRSDDRLSSLSAYWDIDDLWKMIGKGEKKWVAFDFADKVLCILGLVPEAWIQELSREYEGVNLRAVDEIRHPPRRVPKNHKRCAAHGCNEVFRIEHTPQGGGRPKMFCSKDCRIKDNNRRQRDKIRTNRYGTKYGSCVNGHDRSPENTYVSPGGKTLCRECAKTNARKTRERKKVAA